MQLLAIDPHAFLEFLTSTCEFTQIIECVAQRAMSGKQKNRVRLPPGVIEQLSGLNPGGFELRRDKEKPPLAIPCGEKVGRIAQEVAEFSRTRKRSLHFRSGITFGGDKGATQNNLYGETPAVAAPNPPATGRASRAPS